MFKLIFKLHVAAMLIGIVAVVIAKLPLPVAIDAQPLFVYGLLLLGLVLVGIVGFKVLRAYFRAAARLLG